MARIRYYTDTCYTELRVRARRIGYTITPCYVPLGHDTDTCGGWDWSRIGLPYHVGEGARFCWRLRGGIRKMKRHGRQYVPQDGYRIILDPTAKRHLRARTFRWLVPSMTAVATCQPNIFEHYTRAWLITQQVDPDIYLALGPDFAGTALELLEIARLVDASALASV